MELKKVTDDIFYIEDPTNIPIIISNNGVFVVDTGMDKDKGKKIRKIIEELSLRPTYLILSHHHADHTGGAKYLKEYFNLKIISSKNEKVFIENPMLEPIYLSEGAIPMDEFLGKWVKAEGVLVDLTTDDFNVGDFEFLDLKGHSLGMIGVRKGRFIFASDSFFSKEIVDKHIVPYFHDFDQFIFHLEELKDMDCDLILPSHGTLYTKEDAIDTINYNLTRIKEVESAVVEAIKTPKTLSQVMQTLNLQVNDVVVFTLIESSIKSILHSHINRGTAEAFVEKSNLYYLFKE